MGKFDHGAVAGTYIIMLLIGPVRGEDTPPAPLQPVPQSATAAPAQTLKERLGDKASDEQRVDNCKVPIEQRGSKIRPDGCNHEPASR